jgi:hypothetical protein
VVTGFPSDRFQFFAGFVGVVLFEERNGERKLCAQDELWIKRKSGPEFGDGRVVAILLQGVIAASKMGFRGISRGLGRGAGLN